MQDDVGERAIRIAVAQANDGYLACIGPDDFDSDTYPNAMDAAICFLVETGRLPAATYWVDAAIPPLPVHPPLAGSVSATDDSAILKGTDHDR